MSNSTFQDRRHVRTYLDIFQSSTFSLRIRLPSTRVRCTDPAFESTTFWIRSPQSGKFWIRYDPESRGSEIRIFFIQCGRHKIRWPSSFLEFFKTSPSAMLSLSFLLWLSVSSLITCVQLNLAMITVHFWLCQTAARHFEASLHVGRTNWTP